MRNQILFYAVKYQGEYYAMKKAIEQNESWHKVAYEGNFITILDEDYPKCLLELEEPPLILFYEGNVELLREAMLCVIGSRRPSVFAKGHVEEVIQNVKRRWTILSGLAMGVDGLAHEAALHHRLPTVAVIGCGIDVAYPKCNEFLYEQIKKQGCIISEYPNGTLPLAHHFPWRNRILAALCQKCIVIEAKKKSGTLLTVNAASQLNKDIYVFPHRYEDEFAQGSNQLIQLGANLILDKEDVVLL